MSIGQGEGHAFSNRIGQGRPIVIDAPSSPVARELVKVADRIAGRDDNGRRGLLPWRRK